MAKSDKFDEKYFVSPLSPDCEKHFRYEEDGHIVGTSDSGKYTIGLLNLNDYALIDARKNLYKQCRQMAEFCGKDYITKEYIQEKNGKLPRFVDMVSYFFQRGDFDI